MKKLVLAMMLLGGTVFGQVSIGIRLGAPPAPRVLRVRPVNPGPGYTWVDGYWYPVNNRYVLHAGYYSRPPYDGAAWVNPRYDGQQYFGGYWSGNDRQYQHDHRWDRDKRNRDYNRNPGRGNGR